MTVTKSDRYHDLARQLATLLAEESDVTANAANTAALIYHGLPDLNWAGFYFRRGKELVLGPFQGKPACIRIPIGKGVCGAAAARAASVIVPNVHAFPGHIACDPGSTSELVIPLMEDGDVLGRARSRQPASGALRRRRPRGLRAAGRAIRRSSSALSRWINVEK
jgi:L-methionine (R)-S-oxide reductase